MSGRRFIRCLGKRVRCWLQVLHRGAASLILIQTERQRIKSKIMIRIKIERVAIFFRLVRYQ
ncbi:MAG: hypothetical protein JWQ71_3144 [Pedosphaera sp.]|nr:hypothetical protein [Pedosphaera sp.]